MGDRKSMKKGYKWLSKGGTAYSNLGHSGLGDGWSESRSKLKNK